MRIDEFTADEFLTSAQLLAEVAKEAMGGKLGEELKRSYMSYRAAAKAAKAEGGDEDEVKAKVEVQACCPSCCARAASSRSSSSPRSTARPSTSTRPASRWPSTPPTSRPRSAASTPSRRSRPLFFSSRRRS